PGKHATRRRKRPGAPIAKPPGRTVWPAHGAGQAATLVRSDVSKTASRAGLVTAMCAFAKAGAEAPGGDAGRDPVPFGWGKGGRAGGRDAAPAGRGKAVPAGSATERCWLCGARLATYLLMADGGSACADVRWYCRDARACTSRWTVQRIRRLESGEPTQVP